MPLLNCLSSFPSRLSQRVEIGSAGTPDPTRPGQFKRKRRLNCLPTVEKIQLRTWRMVVVIGGYGVVQLRVGGEISQLEGGLN